MNRDFIKHYVENIPVYFEDKKKDNLRIFNTYNRLLEFLKCPAISKNKKLLENLANYCIDKSIKFGATECEVNISNFISENVNFRNAVDNFVIRERKEVDYEINELMKYSPYRSD